MNDMRKSFMYCGPELDAEGVVIERFTVGERDLGNIMAMARSTRAGDYTRLSVDGRLWMSDTDAEYRDQIMALIEAQRHAGGRGLVNGLGLGCTLGAMLDHLEHIDVVESEERVCRLIGKWYESEFPGRVTVHCDNAYTIQWPKGTRWDVVWHDIWPGLCEDNLEGMGTLHRRYGRRCDWQGSWGKELLQYERRRTRDAWWR
jgi:spermidine synthase